MYEIIIYLGIIFTLCEIILYLWTKRVSQKFQWLITKKDENPKMEKKGLEKFIKIGYDAELGWVRKPNTSGQEIGVKGKTKWEINQMGSRHNPEYENKKSKISCYGDSFTFCRQVNNDETWEHYLSKLENTNVTNFGVGNYGIDQSFLRLKREFQKNKTEKVILAIVPDTISRIMSYWKHYYEYGNTFAFKPKFILKDKQLHLLKNIINNEKKIYEYEKYLDELKKYDYFYLEKFKKEQIKFPYFFHIIKNGKRNLSILYLVSKIEILKKFNKSTTKIEWSPMKIIMKINLKWRLKLYQNEIAKNIFTKILEEFVKMSKEEKFMPIFIIIPQKDDIIFIKNHYNFFEKFLKNIKKINGINVINVTEKILENKNLDELYSDDNEYGGHLSKKGNQFLANIIHNEIKKYSQK
jgi:hypothetical protein